MIDRKFWKGRQVLVTGHTGFKGGWLVLWLRRLGAEVSGYALPPPTVPSLFEIAGVGERVRCIVGDVRDADRIAAVMREVSPEIVLHLAAQSLVRESYARPVETYGTNVMGTVNVLEAVRGVDSVKVVLNVTSDKCYENREWCWGYREIESMGGADPYSSSKGCAELVTAAYRNSFFVDRVALASARAGNVIGGGDWAADRLIPNVIRAYCDGRPVAIRSPGSVRPWQHVLEPLAGYLVLCEHLWSGGRAFAEGWNFGPTERLVRTVSDVVERTGQLLGEGAGWTIDEGSHPRESLALRLDSSKAAARMGWTTRLDLEETLRMTVDWYKAWRAGGDMRKFTLAQIDAYEGKK